MSTLTLNQAMAEIEALTHRNALAQAEIRTLRNAGVTLLKERDNAREVAVHWRKLALHPNHYPRHLPWEVKP